MTPDIEKKPSQTTTQDAFLGGALHIRQPLKGYRAGVDAVLLAACAHTSDTGTPDEKILDVGAGVGTVGLCAAHRLKTSHVTLVEQQSDLIELARQNIIHNNMSDRVNAVACNCLGKAQDIEALGLTSQSFDQVLTNPPFHDANRGTPADTTLKAQSHAMQSDDLDGWMKFATRMLRPGGRCTIIHKAQSLDILLTACRNRLGNVIVRPVHPREHEPAIRILVTGKKGSRAEMKILPPLVLHMTQGRDFTTQLDSILRDGAGYDLTGTSS